MVDILFTAIIIVQVRVIISPFVNQEVGPRNWLKDLTEEEIDLVHKKCHLSNSQASMAGVSERIFNGELAKPGQFPWTAVMKLKGGRGANCGATIISPRHLLTARHCVERDIDREYSIFAGGVCHEISEEEDCLQIDMVELNIDLIIMEPRPPTMLPDKMLWIFEDLALIQLEDPIPKRDNIDFICLPQSVNTPLPENLTIHGWGTRVFQERPSNHLRYAVMSTIAPKDFEPSKLGCDETGPGLPFCAYDMGEWLSHPLPGDSGSGFVQFNQTMGQSVIYGVLSGASYGLYVKDGTKFPIIMPVAVHKYVSDICHYINLCPAGYNASKSGWNLGSICLTRSRDYYTNLYPFRGLLNKYSHDFVEQCFKTTEAYWKNPPSVESVKFVWAAVLLNQRNDSSLEVVCTVTLITHRHLVTTRSCIVDWLDANKHRLSNSTWEEPSWILMAGGECYANGLNCTEVDMVELKMDFIAWSSAAEDYQDLAVIQLKRSVANGPKLEDRVAPACLQTRHERFYLTKLIAYGWAKRDPNNSSHVPSPRMQRTVLRVHPEVKYSAGEHDDFDVSSCVYKAPGMGQFPNTWDIGTPAVKMYTYSFAAMFTSVASAKKLSSNTKYGNDTDVAYSFWDVTSFDSLFCTYFNYCPRNDHYLENVIPYFNTFFYPN